MSSRSRLLVAPLVAVLLLAAAACSKAAGDNYQFSADQLKGTTTTAGLPKTDGPTTTAPAADPTETEVATAKVPEVEVFTAKPGGEPVAIPVSKMPAIPRDGLASAGSRKTPNGWAFSNPTYFKNPLVFVVTKNEGEWLKVMLPARPNGMEGWIKASDVDLTKHKYRMELNVGGHHLKVYDGNDVLVETDVVVGKPSSKTPIGKFYLNEKIRSDNPGGAYGPWILSTSGYSEDLNEFDGGLPVVAFHGTNQPQLVGQSVSNGCIRMPNDVDQKLADTLPAGTPIVINA